MSFTTNYNLPEMPSGPVDWVAIINDIVAKLEAGRTVKITAGENIAAYQAVTIGDASGDHFKCDNTGSFLGIATAAIINGADGYVYADYGNEIINGSWSWTRGGLIYVSAVAGVLTQSDPGSGAVPIGYAHTTSSIILCRPQITGLD